MISRKYRFSGQNGLRFVYRKGESIRTKHCAAKYVVNSRRETWRVSVVVSKKVAKSAPLRNRIRRRLYEQVRLQAPQYLTNHDVVITVFDPELALIPSEELSQLVKRILKSVARPL
jgi:ribonuclease P protein component